MPGSATQRIVLCTPYATAGEHDAHPLKLDGETAWCPGNPPRHPDGSPVTGDDVREVAGTEAELATLRGAYDEARAAGSGPGTLRTEVPLAGALREAPEHPIDFVTGRDSTPPALRAETYVVQVEGIECRVQRVVNRPTNPEAPVAWWAARVDRTSALEMTVPGDEEHQRFPHPHTVWTDAEFPFDPADPADEMAALERAGRYCESVARVILRMRAEQLATWFGVSEAVQSARLTHRARAVER